MKKTFSLVLILVLGMATEVANADFTFGEPTKVPNVNSVFEDSGPHISPDGLELYFHSGRPHGANGGCNDIWFSKRSTTGQPWSAPVMLDPPINSPWPQGSPYLSADGLELYFTDGWPGLYSPADCEPNSGGYGSGDLWVSRRDEGRSVGRITSMEKAEIRPSCKISEVSFCNSADPKLKYSLSCNLAQGRTLRSAKKVLRWLPKLRYDLLLFIKRSSLSVGRQFEGKIFGFRK